jgi:hypothetical protein
MPIILATQEGHCSKPAWQIVYKTLSQKDPSQKTAGRVAQGVCPAFKTQHCKNIKSIGDKPRFKGNSNKNRY